MKQHIKIILGLLIVHLSTCLSAQDIDTLFSKKTIDYTTFIGWVGKNNLDYSAEKFNVNIAEANILNAMIFPDPELGFGFADNGQRRMDMGYTFNSGISWTLELGGKRKTRIDVAQNEAQLTKYLLEDYFRNLRADATIAYLLTIQNRHLLEVQINSYEQLKQLAKADSIRYKVGDISQVDAKQSKLEAGMLLNEIYTAQANYKTAIADLSLLVGEQQSNTFFSPIESFTGFSRDFTLQELMVIAQNNRADLKAALQHKHISNSLVKLAKANRAIDLGLSIGAEYNSYVRNIIAPTPSFTSISAGISIPLKFSNNKTGELTSARYGVLQAEKLYNQAVLTIQTEVTRAFYNYQAAKKQVIQFDKGLLTEAKAILDGKTYSYKRGESSLLEVLDAQRTYNDVQQEYYQAQYNHAASLVALEQAVGIWDINF